MIRSAIPSDAKAIAQVHIRSWQQAYRDLMPCEYLDSLNKTLPQRVSYWTNTIQSGDSTLLVAELDNQVIGWISVGASRDPDAAMDTRGKSWPSTFWKSIGKPVSAEPYGMQDCRA